MEYIVINSLFDKGDTVSEGICFTSQSKVTGLMMIFRFLFIRHCFFLFLLLGERGCLVVNVSDCGSRGRGSSPTRVKSCCVLEQGAFTPQKYW